MPRFMMGALALTSACIGYLLAARWEDPPRIRLDPTGDVESDRAVSGAPSRSGEPRGRGVPPGSGDYPLWV